MAEPIPDPGVEEITRWHRTFAPRFFNHAWELMDRPSLTSDEVDEMLASAFAQRAHWYQVGDARNRAIADWQVSRAAVRAGYPDLARRFAERCLRVSSDLDPFVVAFAHEAMARAASLVDDVDTFTEHLQAARRLVEQIDDSEEREVLVADLDEMEGADQRR